MNLVGVSRPGKQDKKIMYKIKRVRFANPQKYSVDVGVSSYIDTSFETPCASEAKLNHE